MEWTATRLVQALKRNKKGRKEAELLGEGEEEEKYGYLLGLTSINQMKSVRTN